MRSTSLIRRASGRQGLRGPETAAAHLGALRQGVEVIEFFCYVHPHCYELEPTIEAFVKKEGDRILFKRVPVAFQDRFQPYSKLYYSLVARRRGGGAASASRLARASLALVITSLA